MPLLFTILRIGSLYVTLRPPLLRHGMIHTTAQDYEVAAAVGEGQPKQMRKLNTFVSSCVQQISPYSRYRATPSP